MLLKRSGKHPTQLTVWRKSGDEEDIYGRPLWETPETIWCRYEDTRRVYINQQGRNEVGNSVIYCEEDELEIGDYVAIGDFRDSNEPVITSFEVKDRRVTPNLSGTRVENRYIL